MTMEVSFPGGLKVSVSYNDHLIETDQPIDSGGDDSAPSPFDLFLASIGSCAGYYALKFCKSRNLSTKGLKLKLDTLFDEKEKRIKKIIIELKLPHDFPKEYENAILHSCGACTVKKHMENPPEFEIKTYE